MADNPVVMARRTAAGLICHALTDGKVEYDLTYRMFMDDMDELDVSAERALKLLVMASVGIAAHLAKEEPQVLEDLMNSMAGA